MKTLRRFRPLVLWGLRFANKVLRLKISDYFFYRWVKTKNGKDLEFYLDLTE